jgi:hypothetical protein
MNGVTEIRLVKPNLREGWAMDSQRISEIGDDVLVWSEFDNEGDTDLVWDADES